MLHEELRKESAGSKRPMNAIDRCLMTQQVGPMSVHKFSDYLQWMQKNHVAVQAKFAELM